jgi:hypothetical protein
MTEIEYAPHENAVPGRTTKVLHTSVTLLRHLPLTIMLGVVGLAGLVLGTAMLIGSDSEVAVIEESRVLGADAASWRGMVREASVIADSDAGRRSWSVTATAFAAERADQSSGAAAIAWNESAELAAAFKADQGVLAALVGNADRMGALAVGLTVMDDIHAMPDRTEVPDETVPTEPQIGITEGSADGSQQSARPAQN